MTTDKALEDGEIYAELQPLWERFYCDAGEEQRKLVAYVREMECDPLGISVPKLNALIKSFETAQRRLKAIHQLKEEKYGK